MVTVQEGLQLAALSAFICVQPAMFVSRFGGLALHPGIEAGKLGPAGRYLLVLCLDSGDPLDQRWFLPSSPGCPIFSLLQ